MNNPPSRVVPKYPSLGTVLPSAAASAYPAQVLVTENKILAPAGFSVPLEVPVSDRMMALTRKQEPPISRDMQISSPPRGHE